MRCKSEGAEEGEVKTGPIEADLVYLDQAKREVAMLLNPGEGTYIAFKCGGESAKGVGSFLAPGSPVNKEESVFTLTLSQSDSMQTPDEYEGAGGEKLLAIPMGEHGGGELVTTGVQATFTVHTSVPVYVRAISTEEIEAKQREEEAATKKRQEEEEVATKKRQEEEATAARKHQEEAAAASHRREEEALAHERLETEALTALRGAISRALAPGGGPAKIAALLEHRGLTESFTAPEAGVLVIRWWWLPPGAHLAKPSKRNPVLVGRGSAVFSVAGAGEIKVSLTAAGRRLVASTKGLKLTVSVQFTPTGHPAISATRTLSLKR